MTKIMNYGEIIGLTWEIRSRMRSLMPDPHFDEPLHTGLSMASHSSIAMCSERQWPCE